MAQDRLFTATNAPEANKTINIVRDRTIAGCITEGWHLLADNIWSLLRLSWPLLAICALWGCAFGIAQLPAFNNTAVSLCLTLCGILLEVVFIWHTALLLRSYNQNGFFPNTKVNKLWQTEGKTSAKSILRQFVINITSPRFWPAFIIIAIVAGLVLTIIALLFAMPFVVVNTIHFQTTNATAMGDTVTLPAYLNWIYPLTMAASATLMAISSWILLLPLSFHAGRVLHTRLTSKKQEQK